MQLCFDATRFGSGLQEAVELAAAKKVPAVEYMFEPFSVADKAARTLNEQEKLYLADVSSLAKKSGVQIAAIKLNYPLIASDKSAAKEFQGMIAKLGLLAHAISCPRVICYLQPENTGNWIENVESKLLPVLAGLKKQGIRLVLSLSTAPSCRGRSLKYWRSCDPQEWRELLARLPELSLSFSAADCIWQGIDYLRILPGVAKAIEHIEAQDVEISRDMLADSGMFGPLFWRYRTLGKGQVDWRQFIEALKLYEFDGNLSIQLDDEFIGGDYPELAEALDSGIKLLTPLMKY